MLLFKAFQTGTQKQPEKSCLIIILTFILSVFSKFSNMYYYFYVLFLYVCIYFYNFFYLFIFLGEECSITRVRSSRSKRHKGCIVKPLLPTSVLSHLCVFAMSHHYYWFSVFSQRHVTMCGQVRRAPVVHKSKGHHLYLVPRMPSTWTTLELCPLELCDAVA